MVVTVSLFVRCPEGLSWEHGSRLNFNEPPRDCGMHWHMGKRERGRGRWGLWARLLVSVEGSVVGGRAVAVVVAGLCGDQSQGGLSLWSQREASEKGRWQDKGKGTGVALGTALQKWERAPGPTWFQVQVA